MGIKIPLGFYKSFKNVSQEELNNYELIAGGIGIHWKSLDEDLSLKGMIKESAITSVLHRLEGKPNMELAIF
jgi:hypothetical protein